MQEAQMTAEKKQQAAQIRYEVEWCSKLPPDECGDADWDLATWEHRHFPTLPLAEACARAVLRTDGLPMYVAYVRKQRASIDEDMLEHEGLRRLRWDDVEKGELSEPDDKLEMERVSSY
jgi:hypothetical protein